MTDGICPFAAQELFPATHWYKGRLGHEVLAVCLHVAQGGYQSSIDWMKKSGTSAHFMVARDGRIKQLVNIRDTAYTNGLSYKNGAWLSPRDKIVAPMWPLLVPPTNPNFLTITIESEGMSGQTRPPAMKDAHTRLLQWIAGETGLVYIPRQTLIGHFQLDTIDRQGCPGSGFDFQEMAVAANAGAESLPYGTFPVHPDLKTYWENSGGVWSKTRYALGYALSPLTNGVQTFQRGRLRLNSDGSIDSMLLSET